MAITSFNGKFYRMSNESLPPPQPPLQLPLGCRQKIYFSRAVLTGQEVSNETTIAEMTQPVEQIYDRTRQLENDDHPVRQRLRAYLTDTGPIDPHVVEPEAAVLGNHLLGSVSRLDTVDLVVAVHSGRVISMNIGKHLEKDKLESFASRQAALEHVLHPLLISRTRHITQEDIHYLKPIYEKIFGDLVSPQWAEAMHQALQCLEIRTGDYLNSRTLFHESRLRATQWATEPNPYNAPLSKSERHELLRTSAYVLERLQCLKEYGISPLIVPAETVGLPWDISVLPPTAEGEHTYEEGAIADFTFLVPSTDPNHGLLKKTESTLIPACRSL